MEWCGVSWISKCADRELGRVNVAEVTSMISEVIGGADGFGAVSSVVRSVGGAEYAEHDDDRLDSSEHDTVPIIMDVEGVERRL